MEETTPLADEQPSSNPPVEQPIEAPTEPIAEQEKTDAVENTISFEGNGTELLGIMLLNSLLSILTLGLYYPWARVARLKFLYQNTYLNGTPFVFSGNGKELFKGFVKFFAALVVVYGLYFWARTTAELTAILAATGLVLLFFAAIIPLAVHGALRYRLSRTSWRGIHFGYRGDRMRLFWDMWLGYFLSTITVGLYNSWFVNSLRKYIIGNVRFGSLYFGYNGDGGELFWINFKGRILSFLTLGIYYFWYRAEFLRYFVNHTYVEQDGKRYALKAEYDGGELFGLLVVNFFLTLFTFGFGVPYAEVRTAKFILNYMVLPPEINLDAIAQTEDDYRDATGDDVIDYLDLGIA